MGLLYQRVLIKISGESLLGEREYGIDPPACLRSAREIAQVWEQGLQVSVAIGGGNIFRGLSASKNGIERATADYIGMLATIMNGLALLNALENAGVEARLMTSLRMDQVAEFYIRQKALEHLKKGRVLVLAGGIGNPYFTSDTAAATRALELNCDVLVKATKVDGVYDKDPVKDASAQLLRQLTHAEVLEKNLSVMDSAAVALLKDNHLPIRVINFFKDGNLRDAMEDPEIGSLIS